MLYVQQVLFNLPLNDTLDLYNYKEDYSSASKVHVSVLRSSLHF